MSDLGTYEYNDGPHSVSDITGTRAATYDFDANGQMTDRDRDGDAITWHPFGMPKKSNTVVITRNFGTVQIGPDTSK